MEKKEVFKSVKGYEGLYEVSNCGRVKSLVRKWRLHNIILKPGIDVGGYFNVGLWKNKKPKTTKVAFLVYDCFGKRKRNGYKLVVDHIDGNKQNDNINNLRLLTNRENISRSHVLNGKKTSRYVGVSWSKKGKKWRAEIRVGSEHRYLGLFVSEYQAHLVYQKNLKIVDKIGE